MPEVDEAIDTSATNAPPEDYAAYEAWVEAGGSGATDSQSPAAGDPNTPPSEPAADAGQTAAESDPEEESTEQEEAEEQAQEDEDPDTEEEPEKKRDSRLGRRIRTLTGRIAELQNRLDTLQDGGEDEDEEETEEVAPSPATAEAPPQTETLKRPMLRDFEDTDEATAWDQYETAMEEYNAARTKAAIAQALNSQKQELDTKHAKELEQKAKEEAQAAWNKAASRFSDYNEVLNNAQVQISPAMEAVMRMDPENGTALAYHLGKNPEEAQRIAKVTLANNEKEWNAALARAGVELGKIQASLKTPAAPARAASAQPAKGSPATQPQPKKTSAAQKPPSKVRGAGSAAPAFDLTNDQDAADVGKWMKAREAQLAKAGKR